MKKVQMNLEVPEDVKDWIYSEAAKDDRKPWYFLTKLVRPMMNAGKSGRIKAGPMFPVKSIEDHLGPLPADDTHKQQSLIKMIDPQEGFDDFWRCYPKKKAKADAKKAWVKNKCGAMAEDIIRDVCNRAEDDPSWADKQYVPNGATYLNGKRWEDEIIERSTTSSVEDHNRALKEKRFGIIGGETYDQE